MSRKTGLDGKTQRRKKMWNEPHISLKTKTNAVGTNPDLLVRIQHFGAKSPTCLEQTRPARTLPQSTRSSLRNLLDTSTNVVYFEVMARKTSRLQEELKQTKPFSSVYQEAALSVLKTADVFHRDTARLLDPYEITPQQYNVLRILRGAGAEGLPTLAIGERLLEETPGMTRLLDRMEFKGLVRRVRCEKDRRQVLCYLTDQGACLLATLDPVVEALDRKMAAGLTPAEAETLVELLERIRETRQ